MKMINLGSFITSLNNKQLLKTLIKILFSISCLFLLFYFGKIDVNKLLFSIKTLKLLWFLLAILVASFVFIICSLRWKLLLEINNKLLKLSALIKYYFIGAFFNSFLPSTVGGDIVRVYYLSKNNINKKIGLSSVMVERLLGISALILLSSLSLLVQIIFYQDINAKLIRYILISFFLFVFLWICFFKLNKMITLSKKVFSLLPKNLNIRFQNFIKALELFSKSRACLLKGFIISFIAHFFSIISVYFLAFSLGIKLDFIYFMIIVPLIAIISMIPLSISGLGIRESSYVFFFVPLGIPAYKAVSLSLLIYLRNIFLGVIGAIFYSFSEVKFVKKYPTLQE